VLAFFSDSFSIPGVFAARNTCVLAPEVFDQRLHLGGLAAKADVAVRPDEAEQLRAGAVQFV
jgi:hypothetical protein